MIDDMELPDAQSLCDMEMSDPEGALESVELKRIVSDKTTDQLETHLELPLTLRLPVIFSGPAVFAETNVQIF
jgi:hypothetical protein